MAFQHLTTHLTCECKEEEEKEVLLHCLFCIDEDLQEQLSLLSMTADIYSIHNTNSSRL